MSEAVAPRLLIIDNFALERPRREVYRALARSGAFDVHVLAPSSWQETGGLLSFEPETSGELHLYKGKIIFGHRHQRVLYANLARVLRRVKPDIVLGVTQPENYVALQLRLFCRLFAPHSRLALFCSRNIDWRTRKFPYKLSFTHRICDRIALNHKFDACLVRPRAAIALLAPYARLVEYIPHPVDCSAFTPRSATRSESITIGFVGRLVPAKGAAMLIMALPHLPQHVLVRIVGEGIERLRLWELARSLGVHERVEIMPPVTYAAMPAVMRSFDIFVLPSLETPTWTELFGRVLIEAMACGIPVVASRSGGIPEVMGDAGGLFPPGNLEALVHLLQNLIEHAEVRDAWGKRGRDRAEKLFSTEVVASEITRALKSAAIPLKSVENGA